MKILTFILPLVLLGGCGQTCVERATLAKALNAGVVQQANMAYSGGILKLDTYKEIDKRTDTANLAIDSAFPICLTDEPQAIAILRQTRSFILQSEQIMKEKAGE